MIPNIFIFSALREKRDRGVGGINYLVTGYGPGPSLSVVSKAHFDDHFHYAPGRDNSLQDGSAESGGWGVDSQASEAAW